MTSDGNQDDHGGNTRNPGVDTPRSPVVDTPRNPRVNFTPNPGVETTTAQPIIPRGEIPCVWMTAGVLNFRLCDRNLECATCPLEGALRNTSRVQEQPRRAQAVPTTPGGCLVPEDRFFHAGHTWVRLLPGGEFEVGLDDFGGRVAGEVEQVSLPTTGDHLRIDESPVGILGRSSQLEIRAPFTGEVSGANHDLLDQPDLLRRDPYGAGYLYRAKPSDPARALADLVSGEAALAWMTEQEQLLRAMVDVALVRAGDAATLNDGGLLSDDLLAGVPPVKAKRIREWIFNAPEQGREATQK